MNSGKYWSERFKQLEVAQHNITVWKSQEIQEQFERSQMVLDGKINAWYQRFAHNNEISMLEAKKLLNSKELKEFKWNVQDYIAYGKENAISGAWMKELENASARVHISRLEALKLETQQEMEKLYGNYTDSVDKHITDLYKSDYYHNAFEIQKGIGVGWDINKLNDDTVHSIIHKPWAVDGRNFSERIWTSKTKMINTLHESLTRMCITGESPQRIIDEFAKKMNVEKSQAANVILTESAAFSAKAQEKSFNELNVEEFEVVETLDSHTCSTCADMDGRHYPMSEYQIGVTAPPFHPRCRGCICPYFDDEFDAVGERAARDENGKTYYVPADSTYKEWEKAFVDGNKANLQKTNTPMVKSDDSGYTVRTKQGFENVANQIKNEISSYADNSPKWSGKINVNHELTSEGVLGEKDWSCDINIADNADDGTVWHEMLHSCSVSYYDSDVYVAHQNIEEATVEFLTQQICKEKGIQNIPAYLNLVSVLDAVNNRFQYGTDMEFAKEIFNIPLPERFKWLEDKVDESLRNMDVGFEDYNDTMMFVGNLKGGENA